MDDTLLNLLHKIANLDVSSKVNEDAFYAYKNIAKFVPDTTKEGAIPRMVHYFWYTREHNPKQIPESFLSNLQLELNKLKLYNLNLDKEWQVKLWVNYEESIAPSLKKIEDMQYPVEIMRWQDEDFTDSREPLKDKVIELIETKNGMGAAYDLGRFIVAEKYGGFLPDLDFNTGNSTEIIVQRGYDSLSSFEIDYIGFKPGHKSLIDTNKMVLNLLESLIQLNITTENLSADQMAGLFSYGIFSEEMLSKNDLYITPQCMICDIEKEQSDNRFYNSYYDNEEEYEIDQCSINPPEICLEANHQTYLNSSLCILVMDNSGIDFGGKNSNLSCTWKEYFQEQQD